MKQPKFEDFFLLLLFVYNILRFLKFYYYTTQKLKKKLLSTFLPLNHQNNQKSRRIYSIQVSETIKKAFKIKLCSAQNDFLFLNDFSWSASSPLVAKTTSTEVIDKSAVNATGSPLTKIFDSWGFKEIFKKFLRKLVDKLF